MDKKYTWKELKEMSCGKIIHDSYEEGIRFIVMRGTASLCAYVGVPLNHLLSGFDYDDLSVECHGGLTFSARGKGNYPKDFWWYGWDYAHYDDYSFYYDNIPSSLMCEGKKWLLEDVVNDSYLTISDFKKLLKFAEKLLERKKTP